MHNLIIETPVSAVGCWQPASQCILPGPTRMSIPPTIEKLTSILLTTGMFMYSCKVDIDIIFITYEYSMEYEH